MSKRPRTAGGGPRLRVVLNVGGTQFETALPTLQRSSMLAGLVDVAAWDDNPEHCEELFLDRDPTVFGHVLRLMRAQPVFGGQLPKDDPVLCASILAEADFLGFEALLVHVKARAFGNLRPDVADTRGDRIPVRSLLVNARAQNEDALLRPTDLQQWLRKIFRVIPTWTTPYHDAFMALLEELGIREVWQLVAKLPSMPNPTRGRDPPQRVSDDEWALMVGLAQMIEIREEADAARAFELVHGSIAEALEAGTLPTRYFESARPKAVATQPSITQLMPVQAPTYFLIGDLWDNRYVQSIGNPAHNAHSDLTYPFGGPPNFLEPEEGGPPNPFIEVDYDRDAMRDVAEWALMEQRLSNGSSKKRLEPVLHLSAADLQAFLSDQPGTVCRYHTLRTPTDGGLLEGAAERTMPASKYLEAICKNNGLAAHTRRTPACLWTHMLITDSPPTEIGFPHPPDPDMDF